MITPIIFLKTTTAIIKKSNLGYLVSENLYKFVATGFITLLKFLYVDFKISGKKSIIVNYFFFYSIGVLYLNG